MHTQIHPSAIEWCQVLSVCKESSCIITVSETCYRGYKRQKTGAAGMNIILLMLFLECSPSTENLGHQYCLPTEGQATIAVKPSGAHDKHWLPLRSKPRWGGYWGKPRVPVKVNE